MRITAQRVVRGTDEGINAFVYWHGRDIEADDPLALLDREEGTLQVRLIEVEPGGNRVRSYLDVVVPDQASLQQVDTILDSFAHMPVPAALPAQWRKGPAAARFACDELLVAVWEREIGELLELARAAVHSLPIVRAAPRYGSTPGTLDVLEAALVDDAARCKDVDAILSLLRQLARARRLPEIVLAVGRYASAVGDTRIRSFLADLVPGILTNNYVPTLGVEAFDRFIEWSLATPGWAEPIARAVERGASKEFALLVNAFSRTPRAGD